ncbi:hypothetical protein [Acidiphilium acidophilum]|uniref:hypothetical protein n=1 Tax=Acidiphilium acidophilum TaxID=76588 RepID=UPI002E8E62F9|nr:hypothetical protein [Acidiphilium acidophilum]
MRKFTRLLTVLAAVGAFAPLAANAANVGTSMYSPSPIVVHDQTNHNIPGATGRAVHAQQMNAICNN